MAVLLGFGVLGTLIVLVALRAGALRRRRAVARRLDMLQELDGGWEFSGAWTGATSALLDGFRALWGQRGPGPLAVVVVLGACALGVAYAGWITPRSGAVWGLVGGTALAALGWLVGEGALEGAVRRKRARLDRALTDWVAVVASYLAVGMPFESAVGMAIRVPHLAGKELKDEWFRYLQDTRLGMNRNEALVALARRCDSEGMRRVIGAVMAAPDEREGLAASMQACALEMQASALASRRVLDRWRGMAMGLTAIGMAIATLGF